MFIELLFVLYVILYFSFILGRLGSLSMITCQSSLPQDPFPESIYRVPLWSSLENFKKFALRLSATKPRNVLLNLTIKGHKQIHFKPTNFRFHRII